ncbi:MAG: phage tail protein [Candidatus Thiodiazotropha sp.]
MTLVLPDYPIPPAQVTPEPSPAESSTLPIIPRRVIDSVADKASDRQLSVAGAGSFVPFGYGAFRTGPLVAQAANYNGRLVMLLVWCLGEVEAIDGLYLSDGSAVPTSILVTHYTGATTQGVDPTLAAAIDGWDSSLVTVVRGHVVGLAYSVVSIPANAQIGVPAFVADIRGRRVYDPRDGWQSAGDSSTWLYSDNPALVLADLEVSTLYGRGQSIDWSSVAAVADDCDELVQGLEQRRTVGLILKNQSNVDSWVDTLSTYAGCFVVPDGNTTKLVSNRPAAVSWPLTDEDIAADDNGKPNLSIKLRGLGNAPTVVRVVYTETSTREHRDEPAFAYRPGVLDGSVEWRESVVRLPGITRYSQAKREAVERLNFLNLTDLEVRFVTHDEGLQIQVGDLITLTSWRGLTNKQFLVTNVVPVAPGRWQVSATEYQPNVHSDSVETAPVFSDTDLLSPLEPPIPLGLAVVEEVYQVENGTFLSRLAITWDAAEYAYLDHYDVRVTDGPSPVYSVSVPDPECTTPAVQDGQFFTVAVRTVSSVGAASDWAVVNITADGKYLIPSDVPSLSGFEVGGEVRLNWEPAIDVDIWRYEIRYGVPAVDWDNATLLDRVDALRLVSRDVPQGTWDFLIKAVDSVNQYSVNPARRQLEVTLDSGAYLVDSYEFNAPTLTNVREFALWRVDGIRRFVTEMGDTVASMFPNAMATYTNPLVTYHSSGASEFLTETWDIGTQVSGTWRADVDATAISGAVTVTMELSTDGVIWDSYANLSAKVTARFARIRVAAAGTDTMLVKLPGVSIRVDAVPREENGTGTSSAVSPTTISLANEYSAVQSISITPVGSSALSPTVDNIVVGNPTTFDVYIFDDTGAQVANDFIWRFGGV